MDSYELSDNGDAELLIDSTMGDGMVDICYVSWTNEEMMELAAIIESNEKVHDWTMSRCSWGNSGVEGFTTLANALARCPCLKKLCFSGNGLENQHIQILADLLKTGFKSLDTLELGEPGSSKPIFEILHETNIETLFAGDNAFCFGELGEARTTRALSDGKLRDFSICGERAQYNDIVVLLESLKNTTSKLTAVRISLSWQNAFSEAEQVLLLQKIAETLRQNYWITHLTQTIIRQTLFEPYQSLIAFNKKGMRQAVQESDALAPHILAKASNPIEMYDLLVSASNIVFPNRR